MTTIKINKKIFDQIFVRVTVYDYKLFYMGLKTKVKTFPKSQKKFIDITL